MESDFISGERQLRSLYDLGKDIHSDTLDVLIGEITYGGRVTDD
jgi:hypothetical protein